MSRQKVQSVQAFTHIKEQPESKQQQQQQNAEKSSLY